MPARSIGPWAGTAVLAVALLGGGPLAAQQAPGASPSASAAARIPGSTIQKAGAALQHITRIRADYARRIEATANKDEQRGLAAQSEIDMARAIQDQGLSKDEYDHVIRQSEADPDIRQRLMAAAQAPQ